jgi:hypothetical protein
MHFVLGKHSFSRYRQPKQPTTMADIETIDSQHREVNSLYKHPLINFHPWNLVMKKKKISSQGWLGKNQTANSNSLFKCRPPLIPY